MKQQKFLQQALCTVLCGGLLAASLTGCSLPGIPAGGTAASGSAAQGDNAEMGKGTILDDGQLRLLYGSANSTAVVFCGAQVLYTAPVNGTAYLLGEYDSSNGVLSADYYVSGVPSGSDQYVYTIYDKAGSAVYTCQSGESVSSLVGDWVLIHHSEWSEGGPVDGDGTGKFVNLKTGEEKAAPDFSTNFYSASDSLYGVSSENMDYENSTWSGATYLYDTNMQEVKKLDGWSSYTGNVKTGWLQLNRNYLVDGSFAFQSDYYNVITEKRIENVNQVLSDRYVSVSADNGGCSIVDLTTGETQESFDTACQWYAGGSALLSSEDTATSTYTLTLRRADGTSASVRTWDSTGGTTIFLLDAGAEAYDADGKLLYTLSLELPAPDSDDGYNISQLGGGRFLLSRTNWTVSDKVLSTAVYGADGLVSDLSDSGYSSIYAPYGVSGYLVGIRSGYGNSQSLYDLLDADGAVLLSGLASISPSADGVFSARRGFEEGWMDASGTWLWSRSVWQDARDEGNSPYFY